MTKAFKTIQFQPSQCQQEVRELEILLRWIARDFQVGIHSSSCQFKCEDSVNFAVLQASCGIISEQPFCEAQD